MSELLSRKYQPVADALLERHNLTRLIDGEARALITNTIVRARTLPRRASRSVSPLVALRSAEKHAEAVLSQKTSGARKSRLHAGCSRLADALANGWIAFNLGLAGVDHQTLARLREGNLTSVDVAALLQLLKTLERRWLDSLENGKGVVAGSLRGRRKGSAGRIIETGFFVWKLAGREGGYTWRDLDETLSGPLPDFLRGLLEACQYTDKLMPTDRALHQYILRKRTLITERVGLLAKRRAQRAGVQK